MPAYMTRRERQEKQAALLRELSGPLRRFLPDSWVVAAGGVTTRVAAFSPSGHGVVHDSTGVRSRPVVPLNADLVAVGKDKRRTSAPGLGYRRLLQSA
jgi:hypothetical protein